MNNSFCIPSSVKKKSTRYSQCLALESRIVFDGAMVATAVEIQDTANNQASIDSVDVAATKTIIDIPAPIDYLPNVDITNTPSDLLGTLKTEPASTIIFVDPRIENALSLSLNPPANSQVIVLDGTRDGFQQIAEQLQNHHEVTEIDVLPWTQDNQQWLGSQSLTTTLTPSVSSSLMAWNDGLADEAKVVFHGQDSMGADWLNYIGALTGSQSSWSQGVDVNNYSDISSPISQSATSIVFVDSAVQNPSDIIDTIDPNTEIVYLDATKDGLTQIADYLAGRSNIDNIQIISHAKQASLYLGNALINHDNLASHTVQLATIGQALTANGDILFYGCELAKSTEGSAFIDSFSYLTQADIAASIDNTGAASKGGNWTLEYTTGTIEASLLAASHYQGILALPVFDVAGNPLSFNDPIPQIGTGQNTGDVVIFNNVITLNGQAIDAIVTTVNNTNITIPGFDSASGVLAAPLNPNWFELNTDVSVAGGSSTIKFDFIKQGTYNPVLGDGVDVLLQNVVVNSYDIDDQQFQEFGGFSSYTVASDTTLAQTNLPNNFVRFSDTTLADNTALPGTAIFDQARVSALYKEINTFQIKTGSNTLGGAYFYLDFSAGPNWVSPVSYNVPTADTLTTTDFTPTITGGYTPNVIGSIDTAQSLTVTVNGVDYTSANGLIWGGGAWSLTIPPANTLLPGTYEVIVDAGYGPLSNTHTKDITFNELVITSDPPVNTIPIGQTVNTGVQTDILGLSVTDINGNLASSQLSVQSGIINVDLSGGAIISGGANGTGTLTLSGTEAQINAALASVKFTGISNDTLTLLSIDSLGLSDVDVFNIAVNNAPIAVNDTATGVANNPTIINVLGNDSDPNNNLNPATVKIVGTANAGDALVVAGQGTWTVDSITGAITFTPIAGFITSPTPISYTVKDTGGLESAAATVTVTMNNAPIAVNDTATGVENTPTIINVLGNDSDPDNNLNPATVKIVGTANAGDALVVADQGTWSVDAITGAITFTPIAGFITSPTPISYTVKDTGGLESAAATVTVTMNNAPIAVNDTATGVANTPITINVLGNDSDPDNNLNPATVKIVGTANAGDALIIADQGTWTVDSITGAITFTPIAGFIGSPTPISYTVKDTGGLESAAATITVIINNPSTLTSGSLILLSNPASPIFLDTQIGFDNQLIAINQLIEFGAVLNPVLDTIPSLNFIISLTGSLRDQVVLELETFVFEIPKWSFRHTNPNEQLEFEATRPDGSELPNWLRFNPKLLKFSGVPPKGAYNEQVMVTAMDTYGNEVHATFTVHVNKERLDYKSTIVDSKLMNLSNKVLANPPHKEKSVGKSGLSERIHAEGKLGKLQESRELLDNLKFRLN